MSTTWERFLMGNFTGLWVDDTRPIPDELLLDGWTSARTFHEAIVKLELMEFKSISLDHDLGCFYGDTEMTGAHIVKWLIQRKYDGLYVPPNIKVHSANIVGSRNMEELIERYLVD